MFAFFFLILSSRDDPLLSREHTHRQHLVVVPTHPFPHPQVVERSRKDRDETKENKIVLSPKRAFLPFFRRRYFFSRRKYLDPLLFFFSSNTLNVPKTLNKKFKKKRSVFPKKNVCLLCVCVCLSLSITKQPRCRSSKSRTTTTTTTTAHRVVVVVMNDETTNRTTNKRGGGEGELPEHNAKKLREEDEDDGETQNLDFQDFAHNTEEILEEEVYVQDVGNVSDDVKVTEAEKKSWNRKPLAKPVDSQTDSIRTFFVVSLFSFLFRRA